LPVSEILEVQIAERRKAMEERVKVFTYVSGEGSTVIDCELETHINEFLTKTPGTIRQITQSESQRPGKSQHITVCVWYVPQK
jgi:hypothetical protein